MSKSEKYYKWMDKVWQDGLILEHAPEALLDYELCFQAVKSDACALQFVPDPIKTEEMCWVAIQSDTRVMRSIPERFKTSKICHSCIEDDPWEMLNIPDHLMTLDLYILAISKNTNLIEYVTLPMDQLVGDNHQIEDWNQLFEHTNAGSDPLDEEAIIRLETTLIRALYEQLKSSTQISMAMQNKIQTFIEHAARLKLNTYTLIEAYVERTQVQKKQSKHSISSRLSL